MIECLGELNEKFFELYGNLHFNDELLTSQQADFMAECLFKQYSSEYARLQLRESVAEYEELARLKMRKNAYTPRKRFFRKNRALKQLIAEMSAEINEYFTRREDELRAFMAANEQSEEETAADESQEAEEETEEAEETEEKEDETPPGDEKPAAEPENEGEATNEPSGQAKGQVTLEEALQDGISI